MKKNSQYASLDNVQISKKHIEHKYFNQKPNRSYKMNNILNNFERNNYPSYNTIQTEVNKSKNNSSSGKYIPSNSRDYFFSNYYQMHTYQPTENEEYKDYGNKTSLHLKPFSFISQSNDKRYNIINNNNNNDNLEEHNYPSNYSYYESKCIKKKKKIPNNDINSNFSILYSIDKSNNKKEKEKEKENKSLNKSHVIPINNRYGTNSSPSIIKNKFYSNIPQKTNNSLITSDSKKKNIVLKQVYNMGEIQPFNQYNNSSLKTIAHQPRSTNIFYSNDKLNTPKNNIEIGQSSNIYEKKSYNKNIKNIPSKSTDNITFKKLIFTQPKNEKGTLYTYKKKYDKNEDNKLAKTEPSLSTIINTPKIKNYTKNNSVSDNKYYNNSTISTRNTNYKDIIKNIDFTTPKIPIIREHYKKNLEKNNIFKEKNEIKTEKKFYNNNFSNINDIKKKSSSSSNNIISTIIYRKTNPEIMDIKNKDKEKKEKKENKENKNKEKKYSLSNILLTGNKNYEEEKKDMKENETIINDNKTEPGFQNSHISKDISNNNINPKKLNKNNIHKSSILDKKEIKETIDLHIYTGKDNDNDNKNKNYLKQDSNDIIKEKNKNYSSTNLSINLFDQYKKSKTNEFIFPNITKNIYTKNNIQNRNNDTIRKTNTNILNQIKSLKIDNINNVNKGKKHLIKKIPINKINQHIKKDSNYSSLGEIPISDENKERKIRTRQNLSELPKYISRLDGVSRNSKKKVGEEWDNNQYNVLRKKTYDVAARRGKKNKKAENEDISNLLNDDFSSTIFVKKSEALSLAGKNEYGQKKTNQDNYVIEKNVNGILNFNIFGVLDGHGDDGHHASAFVKRYIIYRIKNHPLIKKLDEPKEIYKQLIANHYEIISNIFLDADIQIQKEKFDVQRSGTTVVLVIQLEERIICANTGDSRAIAIYDDSIDSNKLLNSKIFYLSYDCKPELPNEKNRIYKCGGVVEKAHYSDIDSEDEARIPYRVWVKDEDYPGLAMSRSIGDIDAKKVGVIPNPQIVEYCIGPFTKYILICSDGIWEFMKNEDCMKIANKFYLRNDPIGLCHELSQESIKIWEKKEIVIDDITVLVIFF